MFIVRKQDLNPDGGASYLVNGTYLCGHKYRWGKTQARQAARFSCRKAANKWASCLKGQVVRV